MLTLNRENARAVHTQIMLKPETHDQNHWIKESQTEETCGTTACVAGWAGLLDPNNTVTREQITSWDGTVWWTANIRHSETGELLDPRTAGLVALGFSTLEAYDDMPDEHWEAAEWLFAAERTRTEILDQLAYIVDTGTFNWDLVDD